LIDVVWGVVIALSAVVVGKSLEVRVLLSSMIGCESSSSWSLLDDGAAVSAVDVAGAWSASSCEDVGVSRDEEHELDADVAVD